MFLYCHKVLAKQLTSFIAQIRQQFSERTICFASWVFNHSYDGFLIDILNQH